MNPKLKRSEESDDEFIARQERIADEKMHIQREDEVVEARKRHNEQMSKPKPLTGRAI